MHRFKVIKVPEHKLIANKAYSRLIVDRLGQFTFATPLKSGFTKRGDPHEGRADERCLRLNAGWLRIQQTQPNIAEYVVRRSLAGGWPK